MGADFPCKYSTLNNLLKTWNLMGFVHKTTKEKDRNEKGNDWKTPDKGQDLHSNRVVSLC